MKQKRSFGARKLFKSSFMRSSSAVWLFELLVLLVIGIVVYNDWDAPLRNAVFPPHGFSSTTMFSTYVEQANYIKLLTFILYAIITSFVAAVIAESRKVRALRERVTSLANRKNPMSAIDFLEMRRGLVQSKLLSDSEFTGVYILCNVTKGKYYVGQSVRVLSRVNQHLTGHGNGDVYADFKYGDSFIVSTIPMQGSGYQSLNDLERDAIAVYDAKSHGYNMTRGNHR